MAHNAAVARLLFAEVVGRTPFPGRSKARMELRAQPSLFDELTKGGLDHETAVFKDWRISARNPVLLRRSGAFADVLKLSRGYRGRTLRLRATKVDFGDLEQSLMLIKQGAHLLSTPSENARSTALELAREARPLIAQVERPPPWACRSKPPIGPPARRRRRAVRPGIPARALLGRAGEQALPWNAGSWGAGRQPRWW